MVQFWEISKEVTSLIEQGKYNQALEKISHKSIKLPYRYYYEIFIHLNTGKTTIFEKSVKNLLEFAEKKDSKIHLIGSSAYLAYFTTNRGELVLARNILDDIEPLIEELEIDDPQFLNNKAVYYHVLGNIDIFEGNLDSALKHHELAKNIRQKLGNTLELAGSFNNIGIIYKKRGDLYQAINYYKHALSMYENIGNIQKIAMTKNNIAVLHASRGELEISLRYHKENVELYEELDDELGLAMSLVNMGAVYRNMGELQESHNSIDKAVQIRKDNNLRRQVFLAHYELVQTLLELGNKEKSEAILEEMSAFVGETDNIQDEIFYKFCQALNYKSNKRLRSKIKAQHLFEEILEYKIVESDIVIKSMVHLVDLLFFELKIFETEEILQQVKDLVDMIYLRAKQFDSKLHQIHGMILKGKLQLIQNNYELAKKCLVDAKALAIEQNLNLLVNKINEELEKLQDEIEKWVDISTSGERILREKIENTRVKEYLEDIRKVMNKR